ncbi:MAG: helix-turn-helix domain-containing protein [Candidatus Peregrinibacteria bacterium]
MIYETVLQSIGLRLNEAKAYVTLLHLGAQPASTIARHLKLKRTTVRVYLEHLVKLGLLKVTSKGRTQFFTAETPEEVMRSLEAQKNRMMEEWDRKMRAFSAIIPELTSIARKDVYVPKVTFYEGLDQLKRMYMDSLGAKTEILCLSKVQDMWDLFGKEYDQWYVKKRVKNKIPVRYIATDTLIEKEERKKDKYFLRESRLISPNLLDISNEMNIYDDKVSIITLKEEKIGVLIQSKEIVHSMKVIFENLWRSGRKPDEE